MGEINSLVDSLRQVSMALIGAGIDHGFGGAIALAYYAEPRATSDIDVGIFLPASRASEVAAALAKIGEVPPSFADTVAADGCGTVTVGGVRVDCFFSSSALHDELAVTVRTVPLGAEQIRVISAEHLVVIKALFDRPKDWVDIEAVITYCESFDVDVARTWLYRAGVRGPMVHFEEVWEARSERRIALTLE